MAVCVRGGGCLDTGLCISESDKCQIHFVFALLNKSWICDPHVVFNLDAFSFHNMGFVCVI